MPESERRHLERELAEVLLELGDLRNELVALDGRGLVARSRRKRIARQVDALERRIVALRARWAELPPEGD